jgi:outer membrane protein TolC
MFRGQTDSFQLFLMLLPVSSDTSKGAMAMSPLQAFGLRLRRISVRSCVVALGLTLCARAQSASQTTAADQSSSAAPITITLKDALQRAQNYSPDFRSALTEFKIAREDRVQGRAALLPNVNYNNSLTYTQGNGTRSNTAIFIANNTVHEYISQGTVHQSISLSDFADYRRTAAAEALAQARAEIAARGLVVTVVQSYYGLVVAQRKYGTEQLAAEEAKKFLDISQKLEKGGEVAHSDVIKARIQYEQQQRDLQESRLEMEKSRLELAVLLFPDFNENYTVVDDLQMPVPLPEYAEVQNMAAQKNAQLRAAVATLAVARHTVTSAWGGLLPSAGVDYFYGIDATRFATRQFAPALGQTVNNLGSSIVATVQIPVWNWGANVSKLKQADLRRDQARMELTYAQRKALSDLRSFYGEAQTARAELDSLNLSAELAAESLRLTTMRYQAGEATVLEVVDAQNTVTQSRNSYADGQSRYRQAIATLQTLTGNF